MKISVVIPTYRRPQELLRCLSAIKQQTRTADEVIVVVRDIDTESWTLLESFPLDTMPLRKLIVQVPGVVAAMNLGLETAKGDIIAFTDDDAAPYPDWLERIETWISSDERIGGVGGRDWQYKANNQLKEMGERQVVGQLQWCGRVIGNHHLAVGSPQYVDVIKGVNMAFRRSAIASLKFDERMRGTGAQVHFELAFTLSLKRAGWKLIFDPTVAVAHYPADRFDENQRDQFHELAWSNAVHNETLALLEYLSPVRQIVFLVWAICIGTKEAFGAIQYLRFLPSQGALASRKYLASLRGRWWGLKAWQHSRNQFSQHSVVSEVNNG